MISFDLKCHEVLPFYHRSALCTRKGNGWKKEKPCCSIFYISSKGYTYSLLYFIDTRQAHTQTDIGDISSIHLLFMTRYGNLLLLYLFFCFSSFFSPQASICRCSQPLSGFSARCLEDEQMLEAIRKTNPNTDYMYVVDTRPRVSFVFVLLFLVIELFCFFLNVNICNCIQFVSKVLEDF